MADQTAATPHNSRMKYVLQILSLALVYFVAGKISTSISVSHNIISTTIFTAEGFALAATILMGAKMWPGIFIGQLALAISNSLAIEASLAISAINASEAVLGGWLFHHYKLRIELDRLRDITNLILLITGVLQIYSATAGNLVLLLANVIQPQELPLTTFSWWLANCLGQMIITPLILSIFCIENIKDFFKKTIAPLSVITSIIFWLIFIYWKEGSPYLVFSLTIPFIVICSIQLHLAAVSWSLMSITSIALYSAQQEIGVFLDESKSLNIVDLNLYLISTTLTALFISTMFNALRKNNETLRENENKYHRINARMELATKSLGLGIWDLDIKTFDLIWDEKLFDLFWVDSKTPSNEIYNQWKLRTDPEDVIAVESLLKKCLDNPKLAFEGKFRIYGPNNEMRWIGMGGLIQRDENQKPEHMIGVNWDITQSVLVEQYLKESQSKLQSVIDAATEFSIITTSIDGTIELFSKGAEIMLGYKASELVGKTSPAIIHVTAEIEKQGQLLSKESGHPIEGFNVFVEKAKQGHAEALEWTYIRKDGSTLPVNLIVTALRDSENNITGFLGIAKDIRAEKSALETLAKAKQDAEQANLAKSRFLANMSHEIRTPMNAILGMIQLLLNTGLDKRQKDYAEKSQTAAKSLLLILNDILDLSKVEAGKMTIENHSFRLDQLINEIATIGTVSAEAKNIEFQISKDNRIPNRLFGDSTRLKQILNNLSGNAIKFTDTGAVFLSIQLLSINENIASLRFNIKDSGIGISKENIEKIFDSFSQAETSTTRRFGGTGLGLTISKELVELMGGKLQVESQPGMGSHFYFDIDFYLDKSEENIITAISSSTMQRLTGISLLVAEDNPMNQEIIKELLIHEGANIELANNGKIALEKLVSSEHQYHAILMDLQMPVMDGITSTHEIRKLPRFQQLPIIAMTANVMQTDIDNCISAGMNGHISKPIDIEIVVSTLLEHCHKPILNSDNQYQGSDFYNQNEFTDKAEITEEDLTNEGNFDFSQIDTQTALERIGNNQVLYGKMLRLFMQDSTTLLASYRQQIECDNPGGAADVMHTLKSLAGTIGLNDLVTLTSVLEKELRANRPFTKELINSAVQLEQLLEQNTLALRQLEKKFTSHRPKDPANTKVLDKSTISQILKDMNELLTTRNMRATRLFATLKEQYGSVLGNNLLPLDNALDQLDFTLALEESRKLHANLDKIC